MEMNNSICYFKLGARARIDYTKKFHQSIQLIESDSQSHRFDYHKLTNFLVRMPNINSLTCSKSDVRSTNQEIINFNIQCDDCNKKLFKISFKNSENYSTIIVISVCNHLKINFDSNSLIATFCFLSIPFNIENAKSLNFPKKHPIRIIGKYLYNLKNCDVVLQKFLFPLIYSQKTMELHNQISENSISFESIIENTNGYFLIGLYDSIKSSDLLQYNNKSVQYCVWISPWSIEFLKMKGYIQIDASFYALRPYVYFVPLLIIDNAAIPLGIVIGPSENQKLFDLFYDYLYSIDPTIDMSKFPILSDEGKAIQSFSNNHNLIHFYCYRHLIEKVGSNSILGEITRKLLYQTSIESFNQSLIGFSRDINTYISHSLITIKQVNTFSKIFSLYRFGKYVLPQTWKYQHGIWNRMNYGVSTCSNHIERLHRTMNESTSNIRSVKNRFNIVIKKLFDYYNNFEINSRKQAEHLLKKFYDYANKHDFDVNISCPYNCGWNTIYSYRFGIKDFPCVHTILSYSNNCFRISSPNILINTNQIAFEQYIDSWNFSIKQDKIIIYNEIKESIQFPYNNNNEYQFLYQLSKEIISSNNCYAFKEILVKVSILWGTKTYNIAPERIDQSFRSNFKCEVHQIFNSK